jgi:hypothetical protein
VWSGQSVVLTRRDETDAVRSVTESVEAVEIRDEFDAESLAVRPAATGVTVAVNTRSALTRVI